MRTERRIDAELAEIVRAGFALNFSEGFRFTGDFLREYDVPANVVVRVINYGRQRRREPTVSVADEIMAPSVPLSHGR